METAKYEKLTAAGIDVNSALKRLWAMKCYWTVF